MGNWQLFLTVLGLLLVVEGVLPFLSPGRLREMLRQVSQLDDRTLRVAGLAAMLSGLGLLYLARY